MHIKISLSALDLLPGHSTPPPRSHPGGPKALADDSQHSEEAGCTSFKFWVHKLQARTNEWNEIEHQVIAFWFNRCGLWQECAPVAFLAVLNGCEPESSGVAGLGGWGELSPGCSSDPPNDIASVMKWIQMFSFYLHPSFLVCKYSTCSLLFPVKELSPDSHLKSLAKNIQNCSSCLTKCVYCKTAKAWKASTANHVLCLPISCCLTKNQQRAKLEDLSLVWDNHICRINILAVFSWNATGRENEAGWCLNWTLCVWPIQGLTFMAWDLHLLCSGLCFCSCLCIMGTVIKSSSEQCTCIMCITRNSAYSSHKLKVQRFHFLTF